MIYTCMTPGMNPEITSKTNDGELSTNILVWVSLSPGNKKQKCQKINICPRSVLAIGNIYDCDCSCGCWSNSQWLHVKHACHNIVGENHFFRKRFPDVSLRNAASKQQLSAKLGWPHEANWIYKQKTNHKTTYVVEICWNCKMAFTGSCFHFFPVDASYCFSWIRIAAFRLTERRPVWFVWFQEDQPVMRATDSRPFKGEIKIIQMFDQPNWWSNFFVLEAMVYGSMTLPAGRIFVCLGSISADGAASWF